MLTDQELGARVREIFHMPVEWQGKAASICALQKEVDCPPAENVIGSPERNAVILDKIYAGRDTKAKYRTTSTGVEVPVEEAREVDAKPKSSSSKKKASRKKKAD